MSEEGRLKALSMKLGHRSQRDREKNNLKTVKVIAAHDFVYTQIVFPSGGSVQVYYPRQDIEMMKSAIQSILEGLRGKPQSEELYEAPGGPRPHDPSIR